MKRKLLARRRAGRSTVSRTLGAPPRFLLKKSICLALGLPSATVNATIEPLRALRQGLRAPAARIWMPVVRLTARHGFVGQLGLPCAVGLPTSLRRAGAVAGRSM